MPAKRKSSSEDRQATPTESEWAATLARKQFRGNDDEANGVRFIGSKRVENSDLVPQQNRLYLSTHFVKAHLVGLLSLEERAMANLVGDMPKAAGREHGGLRLRVYARCGFVSYLWLTRWDGSSGTVIKGNELKLFRSWSALKKGDKIDFWAFRSGGELCFAIGRP